MKQKWVNGFGEKFFVFPDEFPGSSGTDEGDGGIAVIGFWVFSEVEIGVYGEVVDILCSYGIAVRFIADQVERSKIVKDVKFYAGGVLLDKKNIQPLGAFKHFMFCFNAGEAGAIAQPEAARPPPPGGGNAQNGRIYILRLQQQGQRRNGSSLSYTTRYTYDKTGNMITQTQPGGEQTHYEYDPLRNIIREIRPDGSVIRNNWNYRRLLRSSIDAIGAVTLYTYDALGRQESIEDPEGGVTRFRYDQKNNITQLIDQAEETFTSWFDERAMVVKERDSRGREKHFTYDEAGQLQTLRDAKGTIIRYTYLPTGQIDTMTYTNNNQMHTQSFLYDEAGALKEVNDNGVITRYNHINGVYTPNPYDLTTAIDETLKGQTLTNQYSYDIMQRMISAGYSNNETVDYLYNTLGQLEAIAGYMDNADFDANSRLTGYELANGVRSRYEYDVKSRVSSMDYHDAAGQAAKSYRFVYDLVDNIIQRNEEYYSYDRKGQMLSAVIVGLMGTTEYPLNQDEFQFGSVRSDVRSELPMEIPGEELSLDWGAGSLGIDLGYSYMIKRITLKLKGGSGSIRQEQIALSTSMYNREELFKEQEFDMREAQDGTLTFILRGRSYSRYIKIHSHINPLNADGEPIRPDEVFELDTGSVQVYALSGGKNVFYQYAPDGDRQSRAEMTDQIRSDEYAYYPKSDLVRIVGAYAYRYDENGNLLEKGDVYVESGEEIAIEQSGDYTLFEYDLLNRMVGVSKIDEDSGVLEQVVSYRYNHKNLRIERTDDEGTTRYVFDLDGNIIEEHDAEGLTRYVFRNNKHLAKITPDGKTYYYGTDMLGSTTVLFDDAGNAVWKGEISAFGDVVLGEWIGEELFNERVRFTGKDYDEVTGLYYFNARWYDPQLGRFTSEDPVRDGMNWYVYVRNNPLNRTDPTGLADRGLTQSEIDYMTEIIGDSWRGQHQIDYSAIKVYDRGATTQDLHNINQQENVGITAAVINAQPVEPNRPKGLPGENIFLPPGTPEEVKLHEVVHTQQYIEHGNQQALATLMGEQANYDQYRAGGRNDESLNPYNYQKPCK